MAAGLVMTASSFEYIWQWQKSILKFGKHQICFMITLGPYVLFTQKGREVGVWVGSIDIHLSVNVKQYIWSFFSLSPKPTFRISSSSICLNLDAWIIISCDFPTDFVSTRISFGTKNADISFFLDEVSLEKLEQNNQWKSEANQRIQDLRMSPTMFRWVTCCAGREYGVQPLLKSDHIRLIP